MIVGAGRWRRPLFFLFSPLPSPLHHLAADLFGQYQALGKRLYVMNYWQILQLVFFCYGIDGGIMIKGVKGAWWERTRKNDDNSFFGDATIANDILTHGTSFVRPTKSSFANNVANILASKTSLFGQDLGDLVLEEAMRHSVRRVLAVFGQLAMSLGPK